MDGRYSLSRTGKVHLRCVGRSFRYKVLYWTFFFAIVNAYYIPLPFNNAHGNETNLTCYENFIEDFQTLVLKFENENKYKFAPGLIRKSKYPVLWNINHGDNLQKGRMAKLLLKEFFQKLHKLNSNVIFQYEEFVDKDRNDASYLEIFIVDEVLFNLFWNDADFINKNENNHHAFTIAKSGHGGNPAIIHDILVVMSENADPRILYEEVSVSIGIINDADANENSIFNDNNILLNPTPKDWAMFEIILLPIFEPGTGTFGVRDILLNDETVQSLVIDFCNE